MTLQPIMFVLLFAYVFGGVIAVPGGDYHEYLIGGILVQTLAFGMMGPGVSIATDLGEGIVDRFRSLPDVALGVPARARPRRARGAALLGDRRPGGHRPRRRLAHRHRRADAVGRLRAARCSSRWR